MKIGNKEIGIGKPMFIIAEAGVNHDGNIEKAKKLVDAAVDAGADAVKFQTFKTELIVTKNAKQADYQTKNIEKKESQFTMLKRLELTEKYFAELKSYCNEKGIIFMSTPHSDKWSVDVLEEIGIDAYKIGSGDLTNKPLLEYVATKNKPIILSSGMANLKETKEGIKWVEDTGNKEVVMLHCTTSYPCPENKVNLRAMQTIKENVNCLIGYSDHTIGLETPVIAKCLGAVIYEKHFTLNKNDKGPDHKASLEPEELKKMVNVIRYVEDKGFNNPKEAFNYLNSKDYNLNKNLIKTILGKKEKVPEPEEIEIAKVVRKSIIALKSIKKGDVLTKENIGIRRPGEGTEPKYYNELLGKEAINIIKKNNYVKIEDVS